MLVKIEMQNFKSFMEKSKIDFEATGYEILNETNKTEDNILKGALFVGGNATGKSTILKAIRFLLELLVWPLNLHLEDYVCLFKESNQRTVLEYEFLIDGTKLKYNLEFNINEILKEKVLVNEKEILDRIKDTAEYIGISGKKIEINSLQQNQSAIRKIYFDTKFIDNKPLKSWFEYLENSVYIDQSNKMISKAGGNATRTTFDEYFEKNGTKSFNDFLKQIKYNQYAKYTNEYYNNNISFKSINDNKMVILIRNNMEDFGLPLGLEAEGNQTLVNIVPYMLEALSNNAMVVIDEFSSGLHNIVEEKIIKYFMEHSKRAQLFIVSHSTNLLTNTLLRPDQIYTVDFIKNKGSKVNRVSDSKPREAQNLEKMYLSGVFNGIPTTE